jgi:hypothetical protein
MSLSLSRAEPSRLAERSEAPCVAGRLDGEHGSGPSSCVLPCPICGGEGGADPLPRLYFNLLLA